MPVLRLLFAALCAVVVGLTPADARAATAELITVLAAASLTDALQEVGTR